MLVSICMCTHNRFKDAEESLNVLRSQVDPDLCEIVVVDSASNADCKAMLERLVQSLPNARLVRLEQPGIAKARNAAVAAAQGDWVVFVDDDVVPFPDYFESLLSALRRVPDDVAAIGGRLKPRWPEGSLRVGLRWSRLLSLMDDESERDTEPGLIYSGNIAYRKTALDRLEEPFDPTLGRVGNVLLGGEEVRLHFALCEMGYAVKFFGTIGAEHKIPPSRLTVQWLRSRAFWEGITLVVLVQKMRKPYPRGAKVYWQMLKILALTPRALVRDPDKDAYIRIWQSIGVIRARLMPIG